MGGGKLELERGVEQRHQRRRKKKEIVGELGGNEGRGIHTTGVGLEIRYIY